MSPIYLESIDLLYKRLEMTNMKIFKKEFKLYRDDLWCGLFGLIFLPLVPPIIIVALLGKLFQKLNYIKIVRPNDEVLEE